MKPTPWWQPTLSHQHGPLGARLVSFVLGTAGAQAWSTDTSLALVVVLAAFQAEAPLVQQIRRRRELQTRLLVWTAVYGAIALGLGSVLAWRTPSLVAIAAAASVVLGADALAVLQRRQRSLIHEWLAFAAVCLAAPFAWLATTGVLPQQALGLWLLCSLFFGCSVVLLKFRRDPAGHPWRFWSSAAAASALVAACWWFGILQPLEAAAFGVALIKGAWLTSRLASYRLAPIGRVAAIETGSALLFAALAALGLLPPTLNAPS